MLAIKTFFSTYLTKILAGVAVVMFLSSVSLGLVAKHYYDAAHDCRSAVKTVNAAATKQKQIIETRQEKSNAKIGIDTTTRIDNAIGRLRSDRRKPNLPQASTRPQSPDATNPTPQLLPTNLTVDEATYNHDQEICVTNTIIAEGFQAKERADQTIIGEETGVDGTHP